MKKFKTVNLVETRLVRRKIKVHEYKIRYISEMQLLSMKDIVKLLNKTLDMSNLCQEHLVLVAIDGQNKITSIATIYIGTNNNITCNQRDIFRTALLTNASAIIIAHNHPSTNLRPSKADIDVTKKIYEASKVMDILFIDHIIIGGEGYFSFSENQLI